MTAIVDSEKIYEMQQYLGSVMYLAKSAFCPIVAIAYVPGVKTLHVGHRSHLSDLGRKLFDNNFRIVG